MALSPFEKKALVDEILDSIYSGTRVRVVQGESPLGIDVQVVRHGEPTTIHVVPGVGERFVIKGVRSLNGPNEIEVLRIEHNGSVRVASPFDSASYAIEGEPGVLYFPAPWGSISNENPLVISFTHKGYPSELPSLQWTLFGMRIRENDFVQPDEDMLPTPLPDQFEHFDTRKGDRYPELPREDMPSPQPWGILRDRPGSGRSRRTRT